MSADFTSALFQPFEYQDLKLRNRIVMSPMTRYFSPGGQISDQVRAYYGRRAQGEVGLIISEGVFIDRPAARNVGTIPSFYGDALGAWSKVAHDVHAHGAAMAPQLWHVGGCREYTYPDSEYGDYLESPSGLIGPNRPGGRPMSDGDIADVIAAFAKGAADARRIGFDAVEFHGAHGYLFDQFFWAETNKRAGIYGGMTLSERTRFAVEVIKAARREAGERFTLIFRLSQWKISQFDAKIATNPRELEEWLRPLVDAGVDIFDCSQRRFWEAEFAGSALNLAGWVKKLTARPTITVGSVGLSSDLFANLEAGETSHPSIRSVNEVAERLDRGEFDLVAVGRCLLADSEWVRKIRNRRHADLKEYTVEHLKTLI